MDTTTDYYRLLRIDRHATQDEIKKAYRSLALQHHPDLNPDEASEEHIKKLNTAYAVLSDPEQRYLYDAYGAAVRGRPHGQTHQPGRPFGGCRAGGSGRGCGRGRGCGGRGVWQELLRKR